MLRYECCYSSGRQFVFVEKPQLPFAILFVVSSGLITGSLFNVAITFAGLLPFELTIMSMWLIGSCWAFTQACNTKLPTPAITVLIIGCLQVTWVVSILLIAIRFLWWLDLDTASRCALFSAVGAVVSLLVLTFARLCCQEDQRKHHLKLCGPKGDTMPLQLEQSEHDTHSVDKLWYFFCKIGQSVFKMKLCDDLHVESTWPEERPSQDVVTVNNRSLKLIKVCFYFSDDVLCWVPIGGISGRCVGFIGAEKCQTFHFPRVKGIRGATFILKVFQPNTFDKELACYTNACCGQSFEFHDVEGMVKRSKQFCTVTLQGVSPPQNDTCEESSEDEGEPVRHIWTGIPLRESRGRFTSTMCLQRSPSSLSTAASISDVLMSAESDADSPRKEPHPSYEKRVQTYRKVASNERRAHPDEVLVRNRSNQDIRACLYKTNDFCCIVPLVGRVIACGDCILPESERRFNPTATSETEFTLKVYSVGAGAKELTYLTVSRGHAYTFCDSLLS